MNNADFKEMSEKYKNEMIKLYGDKLKEKNVRENNKKSEKTEEMKNTEEQKNEITEEIQNDTDDAEEKFPVPDLSGLEKEIDEKNPNTSFGYLKITVKTGNGGLPLANALVTVSEMKNGKENVIKIMRTDESGNTEILTLPAPPKPIGNEPADFEQYAIYNISASSDGYFREESQNVPIFEGITSIQTFFLIPVPYNYNFEKEEITNENQEPQI